MCECSGVRAGLHLAQTRLYENRSHLRQAALWADVDYWQWRREAPCRCGVVR